VMTSYSFTELLIILNPVCGKSLKPLHNSMAKLQVFFTVAKVSPTVQVKNFFGKQFAMT